MIVIYSNASHEAINTGLGEIDWSALDELIMIIQHDCMYLYPIK